MLSGQPIFIVGMLSLIGSLTLQFKSNELFWFGFWSVITGILLSILSEVLAYGDEEEPDCDCGLCEKHK